LGSIGVPELIMIFIVALVLFGPKKLPEIGRTIGKAMGEFRRATNDLQRSLEEEVAASDLRQVGREVREIGQSIKNAAAIDPSVLSSVLTEAAPPVATPAEPPAAPAPEGESPLPDAGPPKPLEPR
jgi:TatA/E family protein of Tat protein translocase